MSIRLTYTPTTYIKSDSTEVTIIGENATPVPPTPDYIELDWLKTNGKQGYVIDTKPSNNLYCEFVYATNYSSAPTGAYALGYFQDKARYRPANRSSGKVRTDPIGAGTALALFNYVAWAPIKMEFNKDNTDCVATLLDGSETTNSVTVHTTGMTVEPIETALLGVCGQTHALYPADDDSQKGRRIDYTEEAHLIPTQFFSLKTSDNITGEIFGDYIPVLKDGVPCIFNKITNTFFEPQGTNFDEITYQVKAE